MTVTLAIIAGLTLLLPGITALTFWNYRGSRYAKRPEVQLSSLTAILAVIAIAMVTHLVGYWLVDVVLLGIRDGATAFLYKPSVISIPDNPYNVAVRLALVGGKAAAEDLSGVLIVIIAECFMVVAFVVNEGLDLFLDEIDVRSQGWVFHHIVRPSRHGFRPVAYVLTLPAQGELGIGYEGVIADIRQGDNGELKLISIAEPQRFIYRLAPADQNESRFEPAYLTSDREWIGGVVTLDATVIRNVVVHSIPQTLIADVQSDELTVLTQ